MSQHEFSTPAQTPSQNGLDVHKDARALVRLIQCPRCSLPLRFPVTLPCGNSLCRQCLPPSHLREHITYPANPARQAGITCPFVSCRRDHALDECSVNVVLLEFLENFSQLMDAYRNKYAEGDSLLVEELQPPENIEIIDGPLIERPGDAEIVVQDSEKPHCISAKGGRLLATFDFAQSGQLKYQSETKYGDELATSRHPAVDQEIATQLKEISRKELECHICYNLMLDPASTPCGHTWCRKCLARVLDHSKLCATCRRELNLPYGMERHPSNKYLVALLEAILPDQLAARIQADQLDESGGTEGMDVALFVCTTAFPNMPTYLHIFEPRYRLMIRRALNSNRQFGMLTYNERGSPQGDLGTTQFMEYGTLLQIQRYQMFPDGRSFIECRGIGRFRVLGHALLDGYTVGRIEKIEDVGIAEEETIEARETTQQPADPASTQTDLDRMSTAELLAISAGFVERARQQSARWLQGQVIEAYGPAPTDPAMFPYWFASVLPLGDMEKYTLLPTTSVRARLKITARWVQRIEAARWYASPLAQPRAEEDDDADG